MAEVKNAVFALFRKRRRAEKTKLLLIDSGFSPAEICVLAPPVAGNKDFHQKMRTKWRTGAIFGAIIGGSAFLVLGIALNIELIHLPGHMHLEASWPARLFFTIIGVTIGALAGMAAGALVGFGTPEPASSRLASYTEAGGTILSVAVADPIESRRAHIILDRSGGQDITEMNEQDGWKMIHEQIYERSNTYEPLLLDNQDFSDNQNL